MSLILLSLSSVRAGVCMCACVRAGSSSNDLMCMGDGDMVWNSCITELFTCDFLFLVYTFGRGEVRMSWKGGFTRESTLFKSTLIIFVLMLVLYSFASLKCLLQVGMLGVLWVGFGHDNMSYVRWTCMY